LDLMAHDTYWQLLKFEDPVYPKHNQPNLSKCGHKCNHPLHVKEGKEEYCSLKAAHSALREGKESGDHKFECKHPANHLVILVDRSGSMATSDIHPDQPLLRRAFMMKDTEVEDPETKEKKIVSTKIKIRFGVVIEAVERFLQYRSRYREYISLVFFNQEATVVAVRHPSGQPEHLSRLFRSTIPTGDTNYKASFNEVLKVLDRKVDEKAVVILLSDGEATEDCLPVVKKIVSTFPSVPIFSVPFRSGKAPLLEKIAQMSQNGAYLPVLTAQQLLIAFDNIGSSIDSLVTVMPSTKQGL